MTTFLKVWITHQELDLKDWTQSWKKGGHPDPKQDSSIIRGKADLSGSGKQTVPGSVPQFEHWPCILARAILRLFPQSWSKTVVASATVIN